MPVKKYIVVEFTEMPEEVRKAVIEFYTDSIVWSNGAYLPFENWENTVEGSLDSALVIERWMEEHEPKLKGFRELGKEMANPVLIHAYW